MKIRVEIDNEVKETEVVIRAAEQTNDIKKLYEEISRKIINKKIKLFQGATEFYISSASILFLKLMTELLMHTQRMIYLRRI